MKLKKKNIERFYELFEEKGISRYQAKEEIENLIQFVAELPRVMRLYRIIFVEREKDIDKKRPGTHFSLDKEELLKNHYRSLLDNECYLMTVIADKELVDVPRTIANNILHPEEKEITLLDGGKGVKYVKHERIDE